MINIAIGLFLVAALFGIYMATRVLRNALPPWAAVILHGLFAASGLLVLLYAVTAGAQSTPLVAGAVLLVIAALGGFYMFSFQLRRAVPPKAIVVVHATAAVLGVVCLLTRALGMA